MPRDRFSATPLRRSPSQVRFTRRLLHAHGGGNSFRLKNLKTHFPAYDGKGYEIAGFGWHQGWNDGLKKEWVAEYEENLANLIRDLRDEFSVPNMPAVIAVSGFGGRKQKIDRRLGIIAAQHNVAKLPEFAGTVASVETRDFFDPGKLPPGRATTGTATPRRTSSLVTRWPGRC